MRRKRVYGAVSLVALAGLVCLPNPGGGLFDGLPWSTPWEFFVVGVSLPFLALVRPDGLRRGWLSGSLVVLLGVKLLVYLAAPASGWRVWVYSSPEELKQDVWQPTYSTLVHEGVSEIFSRGWHTRRDFPLEWANANGYSPDDLWFALRWRGAVRLPSESQLVLLASGVQQADVLAVDRDGDEIAVPVVQQLDELDRLPFEPQKDIWQIEGQAIYYGGEGWALIPLIVLSDGEYREAADMRALWQTVPAAERARQPWWALTWLVDAGLLTALMVWLFWGLKGVRLHLLVGGLALATVVLALRPLIAPLVLPFERTGIVMVGFGVLVCGGLGWHFFLRKRQRWVEKIAAERWWALWLFGPLIFAFFLARWWPEIGRVEFMSPGDDWFTYQQFAREIFIGGDWLQRAHPVLTYQPLYRYVVGGLHFLFGQSPVAQYLLNVWAILMTTMVVGDLARGYGLSDAHRLFAPWLYLLVVFGSTFIYQIERGLQEHVALLGVMLTAFWLLQLRQHGGIGKLGLVLLFAAFSVWTRLDHAPMIAALTLLLFEPLQGGFVHVAAALLQRVRRHWKTGLGLVATVVLALLAVVGRNYALGGVGVLSNSQAFHASAIQSSVWKRLQGVIIVLSAGPGTWQSGVKALLGTLPAAVILWGGALPALFSLVYRRGVFGQINLSLGAIILGALLPYAFYLPVAYPPRWSIHLLPWAVLVAILVRYNIGVVDVKRE